MKGVKAKGWGRCYQTGDQGGSRHKRQAARKWNTRRTKEIKHGNKKEREIITVPAERLNGGKRTICQGVKEPNADKKDHTPLQ